MSKLKMAACGLDCNECGHYKLAMEHNLKSAEYLVEYFRDGEWIGKNDGAEEVLKKVPICKGCWDESGVRTQNCTDCFLRACCEEKQLNHCRECDNFPCESYIDFEKGHEGHELFGSLNK
jgi:hypothetical protein